MYQDLKLNYCDKCFHTLIFCQNKNSSADLNLLIIKGASTATKASDTPLSTTSLNHENQVPVPLPSHTSCEP